jgi:putative membrane protein
MKTRRFSVVAILFAMSIGPAAIARHQEPASAKPSAPKQNPKSTEATMNADSAFMRTAAMDGTAEVEHGKLAAQNAASDDVKQFGQRMVDDHGKANAELKSLASKKGVTLPAELDAKHKAMQDKLSKLNGAAFDSAYVAHMVAAHKDAVALFQREAQTGKDAETKAFAEKTLPTLQDHLKSAQALAAKRQPKSTPSAM